MALSTRVIGPLSLGVFQGMEVEGPAAHPVCLVAHLEIGEMMVTGQLGT